MGDGRLARGSLRALFALDANANSRLKALLRPHVLAELARWTARQHAPYVLWESALLIEEHIAVDRLVVVDASVQEQVARVQRRNPNWSLAQIEAVMALQVPRPTRLAAAHDTIDNDGPRQDLAAQVRRLHLANLQRWS